MKKFNKCLLIISVILLILLIFCLMLVFFASLSMLESFRIIFGSVYVLFLPGFLLSFIFFPRTESFEMSSRENDRDSVHHSIDWVERIALSFALSISVVPLAVFYLNLVGVKINLLNSFLTILGIILISCIILLWRFKKSRVYVINKI